MNYNNRIEQPLTLLMILWVLATGAYAQKDTSTINQWGLGINCFMDPQGASSIFIAFRTESNHKLDLGIDLYGKHVITYRNGDFRSKQREIKARTYRLGYNIPLGSRSSCFATLELNYTPMRSDPVEEWISFDRLAYQKKFVLYHDANRYGGQLGMSWIPKLSDNFEILLGISGLYLYYEFPDTRQKDPLYYYPVRERILGELAESKNNHFFGLGIELGFLYYFI